MTQTLTQLFSCEFWEISKNIFSKNISGRLLLQTQSNDMTHPLCEKCSKTEFFLVRIFPYSDWIRRDTECECRKIQTRKNSVFVHFWRSDQSTETHLLSSWQNYWRFWFLSPDRNDQNWFVKLIKHCYKKHSLTILAVLDTSRTFAIFPGKLLRRRSFAVELDILELNHFQNSFWLWCYSGT